MPKAARLSRPIALPSTSEQTDSSQLVSVALFSGVGLLVSLIVMILGLKGAW